MGYGMPAMQEGQIALPVWDDFVYRVVVCGREGGGSHSSLQRIHSLLCLFYVC